MSDAGDVEVGYVRTSKKAHNPKLQRPPGTAATIPRRGSVTA
ncbi:MAG: hypothetical protein AVDCRST_MAG58-4087 [uncultured Rubrobacteraceae bacterium]|uniref:Uncharacterized protein n=1 Tax=uncultured Rubrobacteraceae bacterium TaxID=349277 RepID=A0A6J4RGT8_9ACTN|nr:MAG: hypothetical protein AVDCRST_MAG58-4087 [uncultured Rubrobacteraceae bacterium]